MNALNKNQIVAHNPTGTTLSWKSQKVGVREGFFRGSCIVIIHHMNTTKEKACISIYTTIEISSEIIYQSEITNQVRSFFISLHAIRIFVDKIYFVDNFYINGIHAFSFIVVLFEM